MWLIIGLGNPGKTYQNTKHNLGFLIVDKLQKELGSAWKKNTKLQSELTSGKIAGGKIILAKPQTYMNLSGQAVQKIAHFYKIKPENILVIHDDFDLELGRFKISIGASAAGHNGVASIIKELKTKDFIRIRIGISAPGAAPADGQGSASGGKTKAEDVVLAKLSAAEKKHLAGLWPEILPAIKLIITGHVAKAMAEYNHNH